MRQKGMKVKWATEPPCFGMMEPQRSKVWFVLIATGSGTILSIEANAKNQQLNVTPKYNTLARFAQTQNRKNARFEIFQICQILETAAAIHCLKIVVKRFPVQPLVNFAFAKSRELDGKRDGDRASERWAQIGVVLQVTADYNYHEITP